MSANGNLYLEAEWKGARGAQGLWTCAPRSADFFHNLKKWVAIAWTKGEKTPDTKEPHMSAGRRIAKGRAKRRPYATDAEHGGDQGKQMRGL